MGLNFHLFCRIALLFAAFTSGLWVLTTDAAVLESGEGLKLVSGNTSKTITPAIRAYQEHFIDLHLTDDVMPTLFLKSNIASDANAHPLAEVDSDGDGLSDNEEALLGTSPFSMDSDCDGKLDSDEVVVLNGVSSIKDSDNDGLVDGMESNFVDSDNDGSRDEYDPETAFQVVCGKFDPFVISKSETTTFTATAVTPTISRLVLNPGKDNLELYDDGTHGDVQAGDRVFTLAGIGLSDLASPGFSYLIVDSLGIQTEADLVNVSTTSLFNKALWIWLVEEVGLVTDIVQIDEFYVTPYAVAIVDPKLAALVWGGVTVDAAKRFVDFFGNDFHFIEILPDGGGAPYWSGMYFRLVNQVEGIGVTKYDNRDVIGLGPSTAPLLGILWQNNGGPSLGGATTHEIMHQWQAYAGSQLGFGQCEGAHWGVLGHGRGVLGGYDPKTLIEISPGVFQVDMFSACCGVGQKYTELELYIAGLIPPTEVSPIQVPRNVNCGSLVCALGKCTFEADGVGTVTIDDLVASEGPRKPSFGEAPTHFKIAHVLVTDKPPTQAELSYIDMKARYIDNPDNVTSFSNVSGGRGSTDSTILATQINAGHAGAWYNTATSGQGQLIDVEPENQFMFLSWFTYADAASTNPNELHWFTAQGNYSGSTADLTLYETLGGQFDGPQEVSTIAVGTVTLSFADCAAGTLSYTIDTWGLEGSFPLSRAIPGTENVCLERSGSVSESLDPNDGWDGAWSDAATPGQGFLIDVLPNPAGDDFIFVAWFTYGEDSTSEQRWLTAQGPLTGTTAEIPVYETTGGNFNGPKATGTTVVGSMTIEFTSCNSALVTYSLTDDALAGSIDIKRAIPGTEALCQELHGLND